MQKQIYFLLSLFILMLSSMQAQDKRPFKDLFYADAKLGFLIYNLDAGGINFQLTSSVGFRINQNHGIGIGYHSEGDRDAYVGICFRGVGVDYRYATNNGFILKAGGGSVLDGFSYVDEEVDYEYVSGGYFLDFSLDYQVSSGITFGIYYSNARNISFERYIYEDFYSPENAIFDGVVSRTLNNFGISIGFAFPWRGRKQ